MLRIYHVFFGQMRQFSTASWWAWVLGKGPRNATEAAAIAASAEAATNRKGQKGHAQK